MRMPSIPVAAAIIVISATVEGSPRGQELYESCIQCHGTKGEGNRDKDAPRIGGQHAWYIKSSIEKFQKKERSNPPMRPFIERLSPSDIDELAAYVSSLN